MNVALLLVTHNNIGSDMLAVARSILSDQTNNTTCVEVPLDADIDDMKQKIADALTKLATDEGVLILTDSYGSTPCNIASSFLDGKSWKLVSGLNLPMLIRVMNYRVRPLDELEDIAIDGGKNGIISTTHCL